LYNDKDFRRFVKDLEGRMPERPIRFSLPARNPADGTGEPEFAGHEIQP